MKKWLPHRPALRQRAGVVARMDGATHKILDEMVQCTYMQVGFDPPMAHENCEVNTMFNFDEANKIGSETVDTMLKSYSNMATGMQILASEAADYSKKSFEHGASTVEKLSGAKSMEKVFEIQTDFAKSSYETFVQQATKMGEIYADMARDVYKPFEKSVAKAGN